MPTSYRTGRSTLHQYVMQVSDGGDPLKKHEPPGDVTRVALSDKAAYRARDSRLWLIFNCGPR
jgi:hypothetical protein